MSTQTDTNYSFGLRAPRRGERDFYPLGPIAHVEETTKQRAAAIFATVFFSLVFLVPIACIGVILHFS